VFVAFINPVAAKAFWSQSAPALTLGSLSQIFWNLTNVLKIYDFATLQTSFDFKIFWSLTNVLELKNNLIMIFVIEF
jgi:hypothetical protein